AGRPEATFVAIPAEVGRATSISEWRALWSADASLPYLRCPSTSSATFSKSAESWQEEAMTLKAVTAPVRITAFDDLMLDSRGLTRRSLSALERSKPGKDRMRGVTRSFRTTSGALS